MPRFRARIASSLLLLLAISPVAALAHDTWLLAARATARPGARVLLALTSGMAFPKSETAIAPERLAEARVRVGGSATDVGVHKEGRDALALDASPVKPGVATFWVSLHPRKLELTPEQVAHYLEEIGAPVEVRRRWEQSLSPRRWRESYRKHAKTFVRIGSPAADRSWSAPVGMPFELVPQNDPTALRAGDGMRVRLLRDGKAAAGVVVGLLHEGSSSAVLRITDAAGEASFRVDRAGRWLLRATELRPSTQPDTDWDSDFTTLTLFVNAR